MYIFQFTCLIFLLDSLIVKTSTKQCYLLCITSHIYFSTGKCKWEQMHIHVLSAVSSDRTGDKLETSQSAAGVHNIHVYQLWSRFIISIHGVHLTPTSASLCQILNWKCLRTACRSALLAGQRIYDRIFSHESVCTLKVTWFRLL